MDNWLEQMKARVAEAREATDRINAKMNISGKRLEISCNDKSFKAAFYEASCPDAGMIFAFHGGGFCFGANCIEDALYDTLRKTLKANVISIEYPKNVLFPTALEDSYQAMLSVISNSAFSFDRNNISVFGCSAGANLALSISMKAWREGSFKVRKRMLNYPYIDLATEPEEKGCPEAGIAANRFYAWCYTGDNMNRKDPLISPLYGQKEDFDPESETIMILADIDPLKREGQLLAEKLRSWGHPCQYHIALGMGHGYLEYAFKEWQDYIPPIIEKAKMDGTLKPAAKWAVELFEDFYLDGKYV